MEFWRIATFLFSTTSIFFAAEAAKAGQAGGSKVCSHTGFYSKKIVPLCEKHFPDDASKNPWVIQFYHPYVQKNLLTKGVFESLAALDAKQLQGAKVGAVDCQQNGEFCAKHGIREAPTTRVMRFGTTQDFSGEYTVERLQKFTQENLKRFVEMEEGLNCKVKGVFKDAKKDSATPLCMGSSFPPTTLGSKPWLISFYESGDRNKDKAQRGTMNKLAEKFGNSPPKKADAKKTLRMRVGAVDCSEQSGCAELGITTFPTVRLYRHDAEPAEFDSFFDREEIQKWGEARLKEMPKQEAVEVLKADMPEDGSASKSEEL